jgi:hypothetical protein
MEQVAELRYYNSEVRLDRKKYWLLTNLLLQSAEALTGHVARIVYIKILKEFSWKPELKTLLIGIDGRLTIIWISRSHIMMVLTEFICLKLGTSSVILGME